MTSTDTGTTRTRLRAGRAPGGSDVIVVGGGPTGAACAIELARLGLDVLLVERSDYASHRIGETLAPAGHGPLAALGAAGALTDPPHCRAAALRSLWGSPASREHSYMFEPYGVGWHVDRAAFDASLAAVASARGARVALCTRIAGLEACAAGWRVRVTARRQRERELWCRLVVDASGRRAVVARRLGARAQAQDRLVAHYAALPVAVPAEPITMIEAIRDGWWYTAPLPGQRLIVALLTDHGSARPRDRWLHALASAPHTAARAPEAAAAPLCTTSARSSLTVPSTGDGWLAAGDAASARDPLSGDGIARALNDGIAAAGVAHRALKGEPDALRVRDQLVVRSHGDYLAARKATYGLESRWPEAQFWRQRTGERDHGGT